MDWKVEDMDTDKKTKGRTLEIETSILSNAGAVGWTKKSERKYDIILLEVYTINSQNKSEKEYYILVAGVSYVSLWETWIHSALI